MVNQIVFLSETLWLVLLILAFLLWGHDRDAQENWGADGKLLFPFFSVAYCYLEKKKGDKMKAAQIQKEQMLKRQFGMISPGEATEKQLIRFQAMRIAWVLICIFIGSLFCLLLSGAAVLHPIIRENGYIERTEYGQGDRNANLIVKTDTTEQKYPVTIKERNYSQAEVENFYEQATEQLSAVILGENNSLEQICNPLQLVTKLEGLPFQIGWESSNYEIVGADGMLHNEELTKDTVVTLTAGLRYLEYRFYYPINLVVKPKIYSAEEKEMLEIQEAFFAQQDASADRHALYLPKQMSDGKQINWSEEPSMDWVWILLLTALSSAAVYTAKGMEVEKKMKERTAQLELDYCELINKLTLYMNAGMTVRNIFFKLMLEYENRGNTQRQYLYEEITMTCRELQTGVSEPEAYENFGKRCGARPYIRLMALLTQNLRKGSNHLALSLQQESRDAFENRKNVARRLGEEAGTKVLGPMMLMLGVVLVMIMIPAYLSFGM